ncbi:MAG: SPOR domain-containing protein [Gemmatimonadota bacterium]|nr:SPOR domain-containing protein [Gemmatimonadota bacterium]
MRRLLLIALLPFACTSERGTPEPTAAAPSRPGTDPLLLRVPRSGGPGRVYLYPRVDSTIWTSVQLPAITRVLGFDQEAGSIAIVDSKGQPARIDLRLNEEHAATKGKLSSLTSADGSNIFGVDAKGQVVRLEPSGTTWAYKSKTSPRAVLAEPDGSVIVAYTSRERTLLSLLHPPDTTVADTASLPLIGRAVRTQIGDRVYFTSDSGLVGVKSKDLSLLEPIAFKSRIRALAPTPSGDRLYVATVSEAEIAVIDRYSGKIVSHLSVPRPPDDLRMDPLGRYLLARDPAADSAWVIAIGSDRVIGSVATRWTTDLPAVAPDGALALLGASDVYFADGETLKKIRTVQDGAKDFWYFFAWDGFRPRAPGVDEPVSFSDAMASASSTASSSTAPAVPPDSAARRADSTPPAAPASKGFIVSFAAILNEAKAKQTATEITVNGTSARVQPVTHGATTVYRVVLGPFATREEAERMGRASARQYWIYEASP